MHAPSRVLAMMITPLWLAVAACGSSGRMATSSSAAERAIPAATSDPVGGRLRDRPQVGLGPPRRSPSSLESGIPAANLAHLRRRTVRLTGTVDSSPIYLHGVSVAGASHNVIVASTTYGRTFAIDAE